MRPTERIDDFLNKIDLEKLLKDNWKIIHEDQELKDTIWLIVSNRNKIQKFWEENSDLRFSQVLVNSGILPNIPGFWYYSEESDLLEGQGYSPEEVNYWGVYLDKNEKPLAEPIYKPISELDSEHIKNILSKGFRISDGYRKLMLKVLKSRDG